MSKMGELALDIEDLSDKGYDAEAIASVLKIPIEIVRGFFANFLEDNIEPDESMDGDFDSAMASAGHGTDEDYGYYGDPEF